MKIQKKIGGGGVGSEGWGVKVDVNVEVKLLGKCKKNEGWGSGCSESVRVDVNEEVKLL